MPNNKKNTAFILNTYEEFNIIKHKLNNNSQIYIFNNFLNSKNNFSKKSIKDFYCDNKSYKKHNYIKDFLCKNWFKIDDNSKNYKKKNLIGNILFSRLHSDFTDRLRVFLSLNKISKLSKKIYFSSNLPSFFYSNCNYFKNCKEFKSDKSIPKYLSSHVKRSKYRYSPKIHQLSDIANFIQSIVLPNKVKIHNKTLVLPDPYYDYLFKKKDDSIFLNNINPYFSYYFKKKTKKNFFFRKKDLIESDIKKNILLIIKRNKIKLDKKIINIFCDTIFKNFYEGLNYFNWSYDNYIYLINYYKPKNIILPNLISFDYLLINYLAKKKNILTFVCLDGIEAVYNPLNIIFNKDKLIFDKLICYGEADYKLHLAHNIKKDQLLLSKFPISPNFQINKQKKFDFIIMGYQPRTYNLESRWDSRYFHLLEVVKILNKMGYEKIGIKIKPDNEDLTKEINFLQNLIIKEKYKCNILTGNIAEHIGNTKNIIGGISTCVWESAYLNIPYYIYEPKDMGLLQYQIEKSIIFKNKDVCRSISNLKSKIEKKHFFNPNRKIMFNGVILNKLKF